MNAGLVSRDFRSNLEADLLLNSNTNDKCNKEQQHTFHCIHISEYQMQFFRNSGVLAYAGPAIYLVVGLPGEFTT